MSQSLVLGWEEIPNLYIQYCMIKAAYFMGNDLIERTQIIMITTTSLYKTPELGGSYVD